jgi:hypothetical protein
MMDFTKLCRMSGNELAHRLWEQGRRKVDYLRYRAGVQLREDRQLDGLVEKYGSIKSYLQRAASRRFYVSTQARERTRLFITEHVPEWLERSVRDAAVLCEHRVDVLAFTDVNLGKNINWHFDPISGFEWPRRFWTHYDLLGVPPADAKIIHELNRHQHLPRLGRAFFLTNDETYAQEAVAQMESWIDQNPTWNGINWQSSLEIAIRTLSWLWTIFLILPSNSIDEASLRRIMKALFTQLDQVYRYPSTYTSPNTHLIGEAAALFIAGVVFQELPRAEHWRKFSEATLVNEMQRQVSLDGVYCELSTYYHCYAADFYLHVLTLARSNGIALPDWMWGRLNQMCEVVMHFTRSDGTIPLLGDDDGGRVLMLGSSDYRSYRDGLCSGAVLFQRGDFKHQAGEFSEATLWLLGPEAWSLFKAVPVHTNCELSKSYPQAGYFVHRSGWGSADSHLVFDCGGLGDPSGGHGHADSLSFTLFCGGRDLLIDPGTSVYNCQPEYREYFRSTAAHNTVVVDGISQSRTRGTFAWKSKAAARLRSQFSLQDIEYVDGEHDGYAGRGNGITHRRRVIYIRPNYWIVLDELRGTGEHQFDFLYHFGQESKLNVFGDENRGEVDCRGSSGKAGLQLFLYASDSIRADAVCGQQRPIQGWSSERYGERRPSSVLRASIRGIAPVSMMSLLIPGKEVTPSRRFKANTRQTIAAAVRVGDYDDIVVMAAEDGDLQLMDCVMCGEFFWLRTENGNLRRVMAANARSFRHAGETVFDSPQVIPYVQAHFWDDGMVIEKGERDSVQQAITNQGKVYVRDLRDRQFQR